MITVLIRTSNRPELFKRCLDSVLCQTVPVKVICSFDGEDYIPEGIEKVKVQRSSVPYFYNLYCNDLKERVTDGFYFFLDDDDCLHNPTVIENLENQLTNPEEGVICQFLRNGRPKPKDDYMERRMIVRGHIGMPCIVLHHSKKNISDFKATEDGDYEFIREVAGKMPVKFVKQIVVSASKRGWGK